MTAGQIEVWMNALRAGTWETQVEASDALALEGEAAIAPLIALLREADQWEQYAEQSHAHHWAEETLIKIGAAAVPHLIAALEDSAWGGQTGAVYCLGEIGDPRALQPLVALLRHDDYNLRRDLIAALYKFGAAAVDPLLRALESSDANWRAGAALALAPLGDARAVAPLSALLRDDDHGRVRTAAAAALGRLGDSSVIEPLTAALADSEPAVREAAVRALGLAAGRHGAAASASRTLQGALTDADWGTRQSAAEMLIALKRDDGSGRALLIGDLEADDPEVRLGAAWSLLEVGDERAVDALARLLYHPNPEIALRAAVGLGESGDQRAVGGLVAILSHPDQRVRHAAAQSLRKLGHEPGTGG